MMKNYILIGVLSGMVLAATSASAQRWRRFDDDRYYYSRYCSHYKHCDDEKKSDYKKKESADKDSKASDHDYYCYDAWRKDMKREKKEFKADECYYDDRPWAAERKLYKADKKAWKSKMKEYDHKYGCDGYCYHDCER